jgi:hypothetical protein
MFRFLKKKNKEKNELSQQPKTRKTRNCEVKTENNHGKPA